MRDETECPNCGEDDGTELEYFSCCGKWMCWRCESRHEDKYPDLEIDETNQNKE